jgi:hypothetical protein
MDYRWVWSLDFCLYIYGYYSISQMLHTYSTAQHCINAEIISLYLNRAEFIRSKERELLSCFSIHNTFFLNLCLTGYG